MANGSTFDDIALWFGPAKIAYRVEILSLYTWTRYGSRKRTGASRRCARDTRYGRRVEGLLR